MSTAYALANSFTFALRGKRSLRLSPRASCARFRRRPRAALQSYVVLFEFVRGAVLSRGGHGTLLCAVARPPWPVQRRGNDSGNVRPNRRRPVAFACRRSSALPALRLCADCGRAWPRSHGITRRRIDTTAGNSCACTCEWFSAPTNTIHPHGGRTHCSSSTSTQYSIPCTKIHVPDVCL